MGISDSGWVKDRDNGATRRICRYILKIESGVDGCFAFHSLDSVEGSDGHKFFPFKQHNKHYEEAEEWLLSKVPLNLINPIRCPVVEVGIGRKCRSGIRKSDNTTPDSTLCLDGQLFAAASDYVVPEKYRNVKAATFRALFPAIIARYHGESCSDKAVLLKGIELGLFETKEKDFALTSEAYFFAEMCEEIKRIKKDDVEWLHSYFTSRYCTPSMRLLVLYMQLNYYSKPVILHLKRRIIAIETVTSPPIYLTILQKARKADRRIGRSGNAEKC